MSDLRLWAVQYSGSHPRATGRGYRANRDLYVAATTPEKAIELARKELEDWTDLIVWGVSHRGPVQVVEEA